MIMVKTMYQILGIKDNDSPLHERTYLSARKRKFICTHWKMHGHGTKQCWKLHPKLHSKKGKDILQHSAR